MWLLFAASELQALYNLEKDRHRDSWWWESCCAIRALHTRIYWTPFALSTAVVCWKQHNKFRRAFLTFYHFPLDVKNVKMCKNLNVSHGENINHTAGSQHYSWAIATINLHVNTTHLTKLEFQNIFQIFLNHSDIALPYQMKFMRWWHVDANWGKWGHIKAAWTKA